MLERIQLTATELGMKHKTTDWRQDAGRLVKRLLWRIELSYEHKYIEVLGWSTGTTAWVGHKTATGKDVQTQLHIDSFPWLDSLMRLAVKSEKLRKQRNKEAHDALKAKAEPASNVVQLRPPRTWKLR